MARHGGVGQRRRSRGTDHDPSRDGPLMQGATPPSGVREAEAAEQAEPKPPKVSAGDQGFTIESGDGDFVLRIRTLFQADARFYLRARGRPPAPR